MQQDHYKTLGVIDTAEAAVIKAAYKALMQIYHPDRFVNEHEATKKAKEINEAYRVLSNPELRREYDKQRASRKNQYDPGTNSSTEEEKKNEVLEDHWEIAKQFVDNLENIYLDLLDLSPELSFTFKLVMLEGKNFKEAKKIANDLKKNYLEKYFGKSHEIHGFVKWALHNKRRDIALEVNKVINVLGADFDAREIIDKLVTKHKINYTNNRTAKHNEQNAPPVVGDGYDFLGQVFVGGVVLAIFVLIMSIFISGMT